MLHKLAYLGMSNMFAALRLLPMNERDKDAEILALRHQITILERQLNGQRIGFTAGDRAFLPALLHQLPKDALRRSSPAPFWVQRVEPPLVERVVDIAYIVLADVQQRGDIPHRLALRGHQHDVRAPQPEVAMPSSSGAWLLTFEIVSNPFLGFSQTMRPLGAVDELGAVRILLSRRLTARVISVRRGAEVADLAFDQRPDALLRLEVGVPR